MLQSLHSIYSSLPHPLLPPLIESLLVFAAVSAIYDRLRAWKLLVSIYNADTEKVPTIADVPTHKMKAVQVPTKSKHHNNSAFICIASLFVGLVVGLGIGRTVMSGQSDLLTYCSHGVCTQVYHDHCSDWQQILEFVKP